MKKGCSISPKNLNAIKEIKDAGYDYIEANLCEMYDMSENEINAFENEIKKYGLKCEAVNCLFKSDIKLTGPDADMNRIKDYLEKLFEKTKRFGYEIVVFGSGGARKVPEGFPMEKAYEQIEYICREFLHPLGKKYGFKVALEELNDKETNLMNLVSETYDFTRRINLDNIGIVCDNYHIALTNEPYAVLEKMGDKIVHAHTANPLKRAYPAIGDGHPYVDFVCSMKNAGYNGRITVESIIQNNFVTELRSSAALLDSII